jgi:hypothetical protein
VLPDRRLEIRGLLPETTAEAKLAHPSRLG